MSNPTSNFGWQMPTPTDLVTDLPADFEVFGQAVDTSLADLRGGTTGQILSKTTNADMDFTWTSANPGDITGVTAGTGISGGGTSGTVTITNDMATTITASGDIVVGTGSGTYDNLPIGTTGQILTADTTVSPYKVKWATPAGGAGLTLISTTTFSSVSTVTPASAVFSATYDNYLIRFNNITSSGNAFVGIRMRASGSDYSGAQYRRQVFQGSSTTFECYRETGLTSWQYLTYANTGVSNVLQLELQNPYLTQVTSGFAIGSQASDGNIEAYSNWLGLNTTTAYDSFTIITTSGTMTGSVSVYGLAK